MKNLRRLGVVCLLSAVAVFAASNSAARQELLSSVLAHYSSSADSLQREAARFLIENMQGHGYATYELVDSSGQAVEFNVLDYATYEELEAGFKSLEEQHGVLDFQRAELIYDDSVMTAEFLVRHIDGAFHAWRTRPWAARLTFDEFCNYVLPYRGSNEPLEACFDQLYEKYEAKFAKMSQPDDPVEAATIINDDLKSWFHFDPRYYYHPTDQSVSEMESTRLGRCEDMTNLTIYAMRANGLAVTSDYTPYWANAGNNHAWNAIVVPGGAVIPFMGCEANPGSYALANKLAKVYRKTYAVQPGNLAFQVNDPDSLPRYLASRSYIDVTADYVDVRDVTLEIQAADSSEFAYLCVFNAGDWQPIQWGRIQDGFATFAAMGLDIAYLPGLYIDEEVVPAGPPIILTAAGEVLALTPRSETVDLSLNSTTRVEQQESTDSFSMSNLVSGTSYELHYWADGWQTVGEQTAGDKPLEFAEVPAGALYWLTTAGSDRDERIFTWEAGHQVWW